ncbi:translocation and assembly module TamA [Albidovulum inexpectatum]|uniref:Translocation and assembly module TamA n=1 Tax=Albidovulum inexpectatum TaxID=196587 RepID=A0A2S5JME0_9RHOB|nr:autotransporter assembly complex family protein [Albidovulum inexpectatum]PPB82676.1 translocation and assembly module TamA [Albidovulum inexpectatum]
MRRTAGIALGLALGIGAAMVAPTPLRALQSAKLVAPGAEDALAERLRAASVTLQMVNEKRTDAQSLIAATRADYGRLLGVLYAAGHYGGVISILIDGREAADIPPLEAPDRIDRIEITVRPGPLFTFSAARMRPYAPGTDLPPAYRDTLPAYSTAIVEAADAGVKGWRNLGHAKARVADQKIIADHRDRTLASTIILDPGPRLRFGQLTIEGQERMRIDRIRKIAGFPAGEVFDPEKADKVAARLRRTGVFRSVALAEAEQPDPDGTLDFRLTLVEEAPRRFGIGAEASTSDGVSLSGYWLHRNLLGGAERLRIEAAIDQIGTQGVDPGYSVSARIDRPATPVTDAGAFALARAERTDIVDQRVDTFELGLGLTRPLSDTLSAEAGLSYIRSRATDAAGTTDYSLVALPMSLTWDRRDSVTDPATGFYLAGRLTPYLGLQTTGSGAQMMLDGRAYRGFGEEDRFVLAARLQLGTILGSGLDDTLPDYLFFSGGGGTVRGQPYQSLGVTRQRSASVTIQSGGLSFAGISGEMRARLTERIGAVAFYDAGLISDDTLWGGNSDWHAGAGLGLRYDTGIGPIRLDLGLPVSGDTGDGVQIYVGIGQAF